MPVLRECDALPPEDVDTPGKHIYMAIQMMYLTGEFIELPKIYLKLVGNLKRAAPSLACQIDRINNEILTGSYYKALKETRTLIATEQELMNHARGN